jgi:uncharacterized repeat protein (TIGR01451 family)
MMSSQVSARIFLTRATVSALALFTAISPGFAAITNTVTASGTNPTGAAVTATDTENVAPEIAAPALSVNKTSSFTDTGSVGAEVGDVITYTYVVTNSGNTFIKNVGLNDVHEGTGTFTQPVLAASPLTDVNTTVGSDSTDDAADADWDILAPGDSVTFTASYTVVIGDLTAPGAADGDIDNTVTASGGYDNGTTTTPITATDTESVPLYLNSSLVVDKSAAPSSNVTAGDVITYTYVVTNNGNVPVSAISLSDSDNATGTDPVPAFQSLTNTSGNSVNGQTGDTDVNVIDLLWPGDSATFTSTYTVNQTDVDTLQ